MARTQNRIGDVYEVKLDDSHRKFFQYVAKDESMLNSAVIRAFNKTFGMSEDVDAKEVVHGEVQFYAHVLVRLGVKLGFWRKIGHVTDVGTKEVLFRITDDILKKLRTSDNWKVWKVNEPLVHVGRLEPRYQCAELGCVMAPQNIIDRMRTGQYDFVYPDFRDPIH